MCWTAVAVALLFGVCIGGGILALIVGGRHE